MRIKYAATGKITLGHPYFSDGLLQDVQWLIPDTSRAAWQTRRIKTVRNLEGLSLYTSLNEADAPVVDPGTYQVAIGLQPENASFFMAVTDLNEPGGPDWETGKAFLIHNRTQASATMSYEVIDGLKPTTFRYRFPFSGSDPGTLRIKDLAGTTLLTKEDILPNPADQYSIGLELDLQPGLYAFESTDGSSTETEHLYLHDELARAGVPGLIEFHWSPAALAAYHFDFVRSSYKWYYHVVKRSAANLSDYDLSIVDGLAESPVAPYAGTTFAELSEVDYPREAINGLETLVFASDIPIPFYELPKTHLQLVKILQQGGGQGGGGQGAGPGGQEQGTTIIPHLPNPPRVATGRDHAIIYVYV